MSDKEGKDNHREDTDDVRWLLARERGQPGPAVSASTAARYAELESLIVDLPAVPAGVRPRAGWQVDVLAAIDAMEEKEEEAAAPEASRDLPPGPSTAPPTLQSKANRSRRWIAVTAGLAMVAAAVIVAVYRHRGRAAEPALAFEAKAGTRLHRGSDPSVGDKLVFRGVVDGPGELRVYDGSGIEQARCVVPAPECTVDRSGRRTTLRLTVVPRVPGTLRAVLFAASPGDPSGGIDADLASATRAGIAVTSIEPVEVY